MKEYKKYTLILSFHFQSLQVEDDNIYNSGCNGTRTHNHLDRKWTLNHLVKLTKWLSWIVSTYLYGAFDCMFLSCHVHVSEWIHALYLPECQGTPSSKQAQYLKIKWLHGTRTHNHLVRKQTKIIIYSSYLL